MSASWLIGLGMDSRRCPCGWSTGALLYHKPVYKATVQHSLLSKSIRLIYYAKWIKHADDTKASCTGTTKTPLASFVFSPKAPLQPPISCPSSLPPQKPLQNRTNQHTRCKWDRIQERNIWREAVTRIFASPLQCAVIIGSHCERTQYTLNKPVFSHTFLLSCKKSGWCNATAPLPPTLERLVFLLSANSQLRQVLPFCRLHFKRFAARNTPDSTPAFLSDFTCQSTRSQTA